MATLKSIKNKYLDATDGAVLGVVTNTENVSVLSFKLATADSLSKFNLVDGMSDDYNDATGVDSGSTDASRNSSGKYYAATQVAAGTDSFTTAETTSWASPSGLTTVTYLVVGGGGGGGASQAYDYGGGGGGAGGVRTGSHPITGGNSYTIVVGSGGVGSTTSNYGGTSGTVSTFDTISATGGGYGGGSDGPPSGWPGAGGSGGSGGGSGGAASSDGFGGPGNAGSYSPVEGYPGASNFPVRPYQAGGGGGAGAPGESGGQRSPTNYGAGNGGDGVDLSATFGTGVGVSGVFGGGGGGGYNSHPNVSSPKSQGAGGSGGGGAGSNAGPSTQVGVAGTANTGGGGGGGSTANTPGHGGNGGTGVVLLKFAAVYAASMVLKSNAFTAQTAPTTARVIVNERDVGSSTTVNTDIKAYASRDNGTTYTEIVLADQGFLLPNPGNDEFTRLMLHMDGSNDGTTFTDTSDSAHTVTAAGGAETKTAIKKFGTASMYTSGNSDFLSIPNSDEFNFGNGDFTIDAWIYHTGTTGYQTIASCTGASSNSTYWQFRYFGSSGNFDFWVTGDTDGVTFAPGSQLTVNTWNHLAICRDGNNWYGFVNGAKIGATQVNSFTITDVDGPLEIGGPGWLGQPFIGYIDELRISKGIARWTATFTAPVQAYNDNNRLLSGSVDIAGQPAGTNMKYKVETFNQAVTKATRIYATSMAWA